MISQALYIQSFYHLQETLGSHKKVSRLLEELADLERFLRHIHYLTETHKDSQEGMGIHVKSYEISLGVGDTNVRSLDTTIINDNYLDAMLKTPAVPGWSESHEVIGNTVIEAVELRPIAASGATEDMTYVKGSTADVAGALSTDMDIRLRTNPRLISRGMSSVDSEWNTIPTSGVSSTAYHMAQNVPRYVRLARRGPRAIEVHTAPLPRERRCLNTQYSVSSRICCHSLHHNHKIAIRHYANAVADLRCMLTALFADPEYKNMAAAATNIKGLMRDLVKAMEARMESGMLAYPIAEDDTDFDKDQYLFDAFGIVFKPPGRSINPKLAAGGGYSRARAPASHKLLSEIKADSRFAFPIMDINMNLSTSPKFMFNPVVQIGNVPYTRANVYRTPPQHGSIPDVDVPNIPFTKESRSKLIAPEEGAIANGYLGIIGSHRLFRSRVGKMRGVAVVSSSSEVHIPGDTTPGGPIYTHMSGFPVPHSFKSGPVAIIRGCVSLLALAVSLSCLSMYHPSRRDKTMSEFMV